MFVVAVTDLPQSGSRLPAKAADREKAAGEEWPAFEERLRKLGYGPRAIAHAFRTLSGPGTVAEALELLNMSRSESHPIALSFEVTDTRGGRLAANGVAITSVERDEFGIRVNYDCVPPLDFGSHGPRGEARTISAMTTKISAAISDSSQAKGAPTSLTAPTSAPATGLRCRCLPRAASMLRIRITWDASRLSIWEGPAHEVRVSLPD